MSAMKSASTGMPYLKPKLTTLTRSRTVSGVPNSSAIRSVSWWTLRLEVSMTRSASAAQRREHDALQLQPVEEPALALERVRPAGGLLAAYEHLVVGLEEDQGGVPAGGPWPEVGLQRREEGARADVDDDRDRLGGATALVDQRDDVLEQARRQVVDDVEPEVLELLGGRAAAGAGHPGHDDQLTGPHQRLVLAHSSISPVAVLTDTLVGRCGPQPP